MNFWNVARNFKIIYFISVFITGVMLSSCKQNLAVQSATQSPNIQVPLISLPLQNPYYSQSGNLTIQGVCKTGSVVLLSGASSSSVTCVNSEYTFNVSQASDGVYTYLVLQNDDGYLSTPVSLIWTKKSSVSPPSLTYPTMNPHRSSEAVLSIQGGCESGSTISLALDGSGSVVCANSVFNLDLPKFIDGDYNIQVTQTDLAGNQSSVNFLWQKQSLTVVPDDPQVIVGQSEAFTISGGTPPYNVVLTQNNSLTATYNSTTNTYTAGSVSGVTDLLTITDNQGFSSQIQIQVLSDVADHFEFPTLSGNSQSALVGQNFSEPITIKVVDRFGNGVSNYPVLFQRTAGDVNLIGDSERRTNASGLVSMSVIQGYTQARSYVSVLPLIGILPDVVGTGLTKARFLLLSQSSNTGSFGLNFNLGSSPENSVITDLNNDGFKDVLILNKGESTISRFLGKGSGLFTVLSKITGLCNGPSGLTVGRFNSDAFEDVILICNGVGQYSFYSGRGDGTFNGAVVTSINPLENLPVDVASSDFNGDGRQDLVFSNAASNNISVRFGNNDGTFGSLAVYATGSLPTKLAVGDLDNNGFDDIVVINASDDSLSVFINNGNGTFASQVVYSTGVSPSSVIMANLNGDLFKELIVTNNGSDSISVYLNLTDGTFDIPDTSSVGLGPISLVAKDLNSDGFLDLAVANIGDSTVSILHGQNNGSFIAQPSLTSLLNPININSDDFNNDTYNDLLLVSNGEAKFQILPGQASGKIGFSTSVSSSPVKMISHDLDGDGFLDKAVVNRAANTVSLHRGLRNGLFSNLGTLNVGNAPTDAVFVDLNHDGLKDLAIVLSGANSVRVFMNLGGGAFLAGGSYPVQSQPTSIVAGDFNNDGHQDVAVTCSSANRMNFLPGVGDGTFGPRTVSISGAQPSQIAAGDFNDDYILDVAVVNQSDDSVTVFLSNGNGTFQTADFLVESGPNGIVSGFFDSDGFLDLAVSNNLSSSVSILKGRGNGTFNPAVNFFAGVEPTSIAKGDLSGNGREALVVGNGNQLTVTVLFGSSTGNYSSSITLNTEMNSSGVHVDDLNNDRVLDISVLDDNDSVMKVFLGQ